MRDYTHPIPSIDSTWMRRIRVGTILRTNAMPLSMHPIDFEMLMDGYSTLRKLFLPAPPPSFRNNSHKQFFYHDCPIGDSELIYVRGMYRNTPTARFVVTRYGDL